MASSPRGLFPFFFLAVVAVKSLTKADSGSEALEDEGPSLEEQVKCVPAPSPL